MIRCTKCGTVNADTDIFCSKCASFLEWTGVKVDATVAEEPARPATPTGQPTPPMPSDSAPPAPPPASSLQPHVPPPTPTPIPTPVAAPSPDRQAAPGPSMPDQSALAQAGPVGASAPPPSPIAPSLSVTPAPPPPVAVPTAPTPTPPTPTAPAPTAPVPEARPAPPSYRFRAARASETPKPAAPPVTSTAAASATAPAAVGQQPSIPDEPPAVRPVAAQQQPPRPPQAATPDEPRARQPTLAPSPPRPAAQPRQTLVEEPEIKPGDLICGVCGAGNSPDRRFCRRCGNSLAAATVAASVHVPWYRRIFGRGPKEVMAAGDRPSNLGSKGRSAGWLFKRLLVVAVVIVIAAPVVGYFTVQSFHDQINSMIGQGGTSATLLQHPSTNALDKNINTFWLADQASGHTTVTVNFGATTDLAGLIYHSGAPGNDYATFGRPREIQVVFQGDPTPVSILLNDDPAPQQRCLPQHASVRTFDIRIVSSFPPSGANQNLVATREVEFIAGSCP